MSEDHKGLGHKIERSAILTVIGVILLFSGAIIVTLLAPQYIDSSWTSPSSAYQVQMYEVADPNMYISTTATGADDLEFVYHLKKDYTLLAFQETNSLRIIAPPELDRFVTRLNSPLINLSSQLLLLRKPQPGVGNGSFDGYQEAGKTQKRLQDQWIVEHPRWKEEQMQRPYYDIYELYAPEGNEAFAITETDGILENWIDQNYKILDDSSKQKYHSDPGVVYVNNPREYRISHFKMGLREGWKFDYHGQPVKNLEELKSRKLGFLSRQELIQMGEHIFAIEGCWYCHTDQTRTLVQDCVLNGSESFPAPPSSANEYIYQEVTFPGTRRIGVDLSRVGVKRPSRDWHKSHFWSPKTASPGTIMPKFRHFFDNDPRGTAKSPYGVPNYKFEAVFQYLMTKGTRITAPTQAWWLGKDPIRTIDIIEGRFSHDRLH